MDEKNSFIQKNQLTRTQCIQELRAKFANKKNGGIFIGTILFVIALFLTRFGIKPDKYPELYFILGISFMYILAVVLFVFAFINIYKLSKIKKLDFYITTERCIDKYREEGSLFKREGNYLVFFSGQKYRIDYSYKGIMHENALQENEYNKATRNRYYYIFRINDKKILFALPADKFEFAPDEFESSGDRIYPIKTEKTAAIGEAPKTYDFEGDVEQKSSTQYQNYSEKNKSAVDAYNAAHKKVNTMHIIISVLSGVNIFPGIIISILCYGSRYAAIANIIFQTALFGFMAVYFFKTQYKATCLLDMIPSDYAGLYDLRRTNNRGVAFIFLLVLDLFVYIFNLMAMITALSN